MFNRDGKGKRSREGEAEGFANVKARKKARKEAGIPIQPPTTFTGSEQQRTLSVVEFAEARAFEINALENELATPFGTKRVFQLVPRYMRRRAASHNIKRIPKRLRAAALTQMSKDPSEAPKKPKKSTRRKKRRLGSIVDEFMRRQGKGKKWLETHIWHAKRMKMVDLWGFRLAEHPNDKGTRAAYRAGKHQCLIHDASYYQVLELVGPEESLKCLFMSLTDPTLPAVGSARFINGARQGATFIYAYKLYPTGAVGPATFLWKSPRGEERERSIWLWLHPAIYEAAQHVVSEAITAMELKNVTVNPLADQLSRFELTGPRSHAILREVMKTCPPDDDEMSLKDAAVNAEALKVWNDLAYLRTSASLPPGVVIGLTVFDPRISFPPKMPRRVESVPEEADAVIQQHLSQWPEGVADSRIWDPAVVKDVNAKKPSEKALNKRRALALVPGTPLTPQKGDTRVPILLLQRNCLMQDSAGASRKESREFLSGWDVVVPKGWAMAFWKNFIFAGARVGGLRERHSFHFESGIPCFPYDFPETAASQEWWAQSRAAKQAVFDRTPKSKRPNFDKLRISSPFEPHFDALVGNGDALKIRPVEPVTGGKRSKKAKRNGKTASAKNAQTKKSTKQEQPDKTTAVQPAATPESGSAEAMEGVEPTPTTDALVPKQEQPDRTTAVQPAAAPESGSAEAMEGVEPTPTTDALVPSTQPTTPNLGKLVVINSPRGVTLLLAALSESSPTPIHDLLAQQISKLALQRFPDNSLSNVSASVYEKAMARVRLTMMLRGAPGDCGIVYAASREEYAFWSTAKKGQDFEMKAEKTMLDKFPPDSAIFGYITTGRFSLAEGHGQAIACCTIAGLQRVVEDGKR